MFNTLLPPNVTMLERNIEQVTAVKHDVNVPVRDVWNASTCPAHLLPWLAWAVSVDNWDSTWSDDAKRKVIQGSILLHQTKGTVAAVQQALDALGAQVEITEWFDNAGVPGTFSLLAWANNNLGAGNTVLNAKLYADLEKAIKEAAPVSRHFSLTVGVQFKDALALASGALKAVMVTRSAAQTVIAPLHGVSSISFAAHAHVQTFVRVGVL